jgi:hypothetical protein
MVGGGCRCEAPAGSYILKPASSQGSSCQYEIDIRYDKLVAHKPEGQFQTLAKMRILSFDIECAVRAQCRIGFARVLQTTQTPSAMVGGGGVFESAAQCFVPPLAAGTLYARESNTPHTPRGQTQSPAVPPHLASRSRRGSPADHADASAA